MHKTFVLAALLAAPGAAIASQPCAFTAPQSLNLDLGSSKTVMFEVNSHDLRLQASPGARAAISGRGCASSQELLDQLTLSQRKVGDKLVVTLERRNQGLNINMGNTYAYLDLTGSLPDDILVQLKVGSGDASLVGAKSMSADVGSGDISARDIKGLATAAVGSGDVEFHNIGSLHVLSVGSGDARIDGVRSDARVGTVGSGDVELRGVQGAVSIESIGSGDVDIRDSRGAVQLGSLGSGDLDVRGAASLKVDSLGSGSVNHSDITGSIDLPKKR